MYTALGMPQVGINFGVSDILIYLASAAGHSILEAILGH